MGTFQFEIYFYGTVNTNFQSDEHREPLLKRWKLTHFFGVSEIFGIFIACLFHLH